MVGAPLAVAAGEALPHGAAEHETLHVTPLFAPSLVTIPVNVAVAPASTVAWVGATETVIAGTVIVTAADFVASVTEVAVSVAVTLLAGGLGGV